MKIFFECPHCKQSYVTNSVLSGFTISCKTCPTRIKVPMRSLAAPNVIEIDPKDELDPNGKIRGARVVMSIPSVSSIDAWMKENA